jgi:EpsD family peptidyl-prolyl cis-trans isomerase
MTAACCTLLMLGACDRAPKPPKGQVVAIVGSREITRRELQVEMNGVTTATQAIQKAQQQIALQRIVQRAILVQAAKDQGIDKDPSFALLSQRASDQLLVDLLEKKVANSVPPPSDEEVAQFKQANPNMFAERRLFDVDQIRMPRPADRTIIPKLEPLKTLDEIATFLSQNHLPFQRGTNVMDAVGQDPKLLNAIVALPPHEVFMLSSNSEIFINQIRETKLSPFDGPAATKYAVNLLKGQHATDAVSKQMRGFLMKAGSAVRINPEFEPPKVVVLRGKAH